MTVEIHNPTYAYVGAFVDELVRSGVRHAVICPGSRSTPLALTCAGNSSIRSWVLIDERSAAFFALGLAKASATPVVVICTSGTAAANFLPAIAEARLSRVPLVILSADRPPELRDNGAPQTIDQLRLYGTHVNWFVELGLPEATNEQLAYARTIACRAVAATLAPPIGPVHVNLAFREPLTPGPVAAQPLPPLDERNPAAWDGRPNGQPYVRVEMGRAVPSSVVLTQLATELSGIERGLIIVGPQPDVVLAEPLARLAAALGYPLLADPLSQIRNGPFDHSLVIDRYDAFLRDEHVFNAAVPELVIRFGAMPTAKPLQLYLKAHQHCRQIVVDCQGGWNEPLLQAERMIHADLLYLIEGLLSHLVPRPHPSTWATLWQTAAHRTRCRLEQEIAAFQEPFEGRIWSELAAVLPERSTLFVGNSMPIRDCDTFWPVSDATIRIVGNRGANGIDGVVSTALGMAAASEPVLLVLGDLSFLHDLGGLLAAKRYPLKATIVVINNDGGGIFSFLPQAAHPDHFETLFGTPHGVDLRHAAELFGATFYRVTEWSAFRAAVVAGLAADGLTIIELPTDRATNVTMHRHLWQAITADLADLSLADLS